MGPRSAPHSDLACYGYVLPMQHQRLECLSLLHRQDPGTPTWFVCLNGYWYAGWPDPPGRNQVRPASEGAGDSVAITSRVVNSRIPGGLTTLAAGADIHQQVIGSRI